MMNEYYVIDGDKIINCITSSSRESAEQALSRHYKNTENLRLDSSPPIHMLEQYKYWHERP